MIKKNGIINMIVSIGWIGIGFLLVLVGLGLLSYFGVIN